MINDDSNMFLLIRQYHSKYVSEISYVKPRFHKISGGLKS